VIAGGARYRVGENDVQLPQARRIGDRVDPDDPLVLDPEAEHDA
jgi:hypothetical protein